jgi:hypothetical protein
MVHLSYSHTAASQENSFKTKEHTTSGRDWSQRRKL